MALQVRNVSKTYHYSDINTRSESTRDHLVLNNISMDVGQGEFVTIVGPSGCGKSTLLNIITGLDRPDAGSVSRGAVIKSSTDPRSIIIFQEGALFPWLTVAENVEFGLKVAKVPRDRRRKIASGFIDMVQLSQFADAYVYQLSGGMKQRAAIARALALSPDVLLMDEPFGSLDVQTRNLLHSQLVQIYEATRVTIMFVTHNIDEAILLGSRVIVMSPRHGSIQKEFAIELPRPRNIDSSEIRKIKREILQALEEGFQFARTTADKEAAN